VSTCPYCHQALAVERLGVRLPVLKAAIVDRIRAAGDLGVTTIEILSSDVYDGRRRVTSATIKAHVNQINDLLCATDWVITSDRRRWFLTRRRTDPAPYGKSPLFLCKPPEKNADGPPRAP